MTLLPHRGIAPLFATPPKTNLEEEALTLSSEHIAYYQSSRRVSAEKLLLEHVTIQTVNEQMEIRTSLK